MDISCLFNLPSLPRNAPKAENTRAQKKDMQKCPKNMLFHESLLDAQIDPPGLNNAIAPTTRTTMMTETAPTMKALGLIPTSRVFIPFKFFLGG
jgi:hypothetical protein